MLLSHVHIRRHAHAPPPRASPQAQEFAKWCDVAEDDIFNLGAAPAQNQKRSQLCEEWRREGGVMLCGYDQYRNLTTRKMKVSCGEAAGSEP